MEEIKNHKWKQIQGHPRDYFKCINCGIEKTDTKYGWNYSDYKGLYTYRRPNCIKK
jgi:hypothetical protein